MEEKEDLPLITIITPSYNQGMFLEHTIRSVLSQGFANIEYMIIDGGSADGSVEIIKRYDGQLAYWASRSDNGQAEAINEGFRKARGKYIAWLNSDDLYLPDCVIKAVENLEANPDAGMVFGQVEVIDAAGSQIGKFRPVTYKFEDLLTYKIIIPQQAAFFRRSILDEIGLLDTDLHFALDHDFFLRIGKSHPIISIPTVMAQYRLSNSNKGTTMRSRWAPELILILDKFFFRSEETKEFHTIKHQAYAGAYYRGACNMLDDGFYHSARRWYINSVKRHSIYLLRIRWWINLIRSFLGKSGNEHYLKLKVWLARSGYLDVRYDWWTALQLTKKRDKS